VIGPVGGLHARSAVSYALDERQLGAWKSRPELSVWPFPSGDRGFLPDRVGVERITFAPETSPISASSRCGYRGEPVLRRPVGESGEHLVGLGPSGSLAVRVMTCPWRQAAKPWCQVSGLTWHHGAGYGATVASDQPIITASVIGAVVESASACPVSGTVTTLRCAAGE
jgi:hypothetical protein